MTHRLVHVGLGGRGRHWAEDAIPPNVEAGRIEVVAAVDTDPERLARAENGLGLSADRCYTDLETALDERDADWISIVTPPATHEPIVETALEHDLHILSEKPIAHTLEGSVRIARKVREAGKKMGITMSHRFDRDKTTFRRAVEADGPVDFLSAEFVGSIRERGYYSEYVYEMEDLLLLDGAVHHLDMLASFADAPCERVYAETWTPEWADYDGKCAGTVTMRFADGTRAQYEGNYASPAELNGWGNERFRAECEDETVVLDRREVRRYPYEPFEPRTRDWGDDEDDADDEPTTSADDGDEDDADAGRSGTPVPLVERETWETAWLVEQFCDWLDGGDPMPTNVHDNLQSMAIVFAAIESGETGEAVDVQALLDDARENA